MRWPTPWTGWAPGAPLRTFGIAYVLGLLLAPAGALLLPALPVLLAGGPPGIRPAGVGLALGILLGLAHPAVGTPAWEHVAGWTLPACHQVEGVVRETTPPSADGCSFVLDPARLGERDRVVNLPGGVRLTLPRPPDPDDLPRPGDRVRVVAWVDAPPRARNPGQVDRAAVEARRGVVLRGWVPGPGALTRVRRSTSLAAELASVRSAAAGRLDTRLDRADAGLGRALLLGDRTRITAADRERFAHTGQGHLLAVSGLHVGLLLAAVFALARRAGCGRRSSSWLGIVVVLLYVPLAGAPASAVRAGTGAVLLFVGRIVRRRASGVCLLTAVAVLLLSIDPAGIHDPALRLSLGAVLGIVLLTPRIDALLVPPNPLGPSIVEPTRAPLRRGLAVSLAAWLGVAPLLALHLGRLSPWAAPLSVLTVPVTALVLAAGGLVLAVPPVIGLGDVASSVFGLALDLLRLLLDGARGLGAESLPATAPGVGWLLLYAAALLVAARGRGRAVRVACVAMPVLLVVVLWPRAEPPPREPRLVLLDVGHGQAALLSFPDGRHTLLDAGRTGDPHVGRRIVVPALRSLGVRRLALVALSHTDEDHAGGIADVLDAFQVDVLALASAERGARTFSLHDAGVPVRRVAAGDRLLAGSWGRLVVLHPPATLPRGVRRNDRSLVLRLDPPESRRARLILPGDLEARGVSALLEAVGPDAVRAAVLVLPHHGRPGVGRDRLRGETGADLELASTGRSVLPSLPAGTVATASSGALVVELRPDGPRLHAPFAPPPSQDYDPRPIMHLALSTGRLVDLWPWILALVVFAAVSVRPLRWLEAPAAAAAWILGVATLAAFGTSGLAALFAPFVVATLLGRLPGPGRDRDRGRTLRQVVANGLPAFLGALLALSGQVAAGIVFFLGALSCLGADTCATEIGVRYGGVPRLAISGRRVEPGESGGVTQLGFLASIVGASLAPVAALAAEGQWVFHALLPMTAGVLAAWLDSVLGATVQYRGRDPATGAISERRRTEHGATVRVSGIRCLDNDGVNLVTGVVGGLLSLFLVAWLTFGA